MNRTALLALLLLGACSKPDAPPAASIAVTDTAPAADTTGPAPVDPNVVPPDTLILTLADSTEVWLTAGRVTHDSAGTACRERGIELRKGTTAKIVPLLYVQQPPRARHDSLFAMMSKDCALLERYVVDQRTAQPTVATSSRKAGR